MLQKWFTKEVGYNQIGPTNKHRGSTGKGMNDDNHKAKCLKKEFKRS